MRAYAPPRTQANAVLVTVGERRKKKKKKKKKTQTAV